MKILPVLFKDYYKVNHAVQYPEGTEVVYSNFTPRDSRNPEIKEVVVFGSQYLVKEYLMNQFNEQFFQRPKHEVVNAYKRRMDTSLGPNAVDVSRIEALHDLGYLPIKVKSLPEGSRVPFKTPVLTIRNTLPKFFWVTNFLETLISTALWHPMTSATTAYEYKKLLTKFAEETSDMLDFVPWQGHDFSMRGQSSIESATVSGAAHLLSFTGTDTIPSIDFLEQYYGANAEKEMIGGSVNATEHSVMCMGGKETERETFLRLLTQVHPEGILSVVSDTWDYWRTLTDIVPSLKDVIMNRNGKLVVRPDSGDPVKIVCGDMNAPADSVERKGSIEHLWDVFGGTVNSKGYKQLDPHIGLIYGDSITVERARQICQNLKEKGFASTNVVFGIGSYTYQHTTRDVLGFAMKATYGEIHGVPYNIFKNPKTDNGVKKSAKGLLRVNADMSLTEECSWYQEDEGLLETIFEDGQLIKETTLSEIRARLK